MSSDVLVSSPSSTKDLILMEDIKNWCLVQGFADFQCLESL